MGRVLSLIHGETWIKSVFNFLHSAVFFFFTFLYDKNTANVLGVPREK